MFHNHIALLAILLFYIFYIYIYIYIYIFSFKIIKNKRRLELNVNRLQVDAFRFIHNFPEEDILNIPEAGGLFK